MFGVALFASGLTVLLVTWPMLRPTRPATEAWTVDPATGSWPLDEVGSPADLRPSGRRPAPRHRRRGRRRAERTGLLRRRVPPPRVAGTAQVPRQRRGDPGADDMTPRPGVGRIGGPSPAAVPVIGTTVAGIPYRGIAPVPDGPRQDP